MSEEEGRFNVEVPDAGFLVAVDEEDGRRSAFESSLGIL